MISRLALGYVLAVLFFVPFLANRMDADQSFRLAIQMSTDTAGRLQVFYDIGNGFREADSAAAPLVSGRHDYQLLLPWGNYRNLRIDPGTAAGRYTIDRVAILRADGSTIRLIPLGEIRPAVQLSLVELTDEHLIVDSPAGSNDPQMLYLPGSGFSLSRIERSQVLITLLVFWAVAVLLVFLLELSLRPAAVRVAQWLQTLTRWADVHPRDAVLGAAAIATLIATYPVLFLNRSFVSPNNGGTAYLYDRPPFVPGSHDLDVEDVRGSDVGATMWQFVPYSKIQHDALSEGQVPLWNRFNASGRPLWGQGQGFLVDPLHWLTLGGFDRALGWDLKLVGHRFVFAAGVGFAALAASSGWLPAAVAASIVPFLGYFAFRFNHSAVFSLSYAPWVLVVWFALARAQTKSQMARAALLLAVTNALMLLASSPKEAFVMAAGCQTAGVIALLLGRQGTRERLHCLAYTVAAGVAMLMITAPHWLVFLDTLHSSSTTYDIPKALVGPDEAAPGIFLGFLNHRFILPPLHIMAMVLLIAAFAPFRLIQRPAILACLMTAIGLTAIGFGAIPAAWLIRIPLVANIYSINVTTISAAIVLLLVVCAFGVEVLLDASLPRAFGLTCFVALSAALLLRDVAIHTTDRLELWLGALLLAGTIPMPLCVYAWRRAPRRVLPALSTLSLGALLLVPGGLHPVTGIKALDQLLEQPRPRVDLDETSPAVDAVHRSMSEPSRVVGLGVMLLPGTQALYGLESIGGADALYVPYYEELVDAARIERPWGPLEKGGWLTIVSPSNLKQMAPLLDMLNVGFVLAPADSVPPGFVEAQMQGPDLLKALRRPTGWPRAFFADGASTYVDASDLIRKLCVAEKPFAAVQAGDRFAIDAIRGLPTPSGTVIAAQSYQLTVNTTSFVVRASAAGVAVLSEAYIKDDFRATLNGRPVPYFRVNHAFKGVAIPSAGEWAVKFEYRPHHWDLSLAIAGVGILLLMVLGVAARRPRNVRATTSRVNTAAQASS